MKKIFALLSLIAMLTVVFTSQTLANDHTVIVKELKMDVTVDAVNYPTFGGVVDKPDIFSRDFYTIIFVTETTDTFKDLPFEVGWIFEKSTIISKFENQLVVRKDLPFEVGWNVETTNTINKADAVADTYKDLPFEVGWTK